MDVNRRVSVVKKKKKK
jgi:hypothetical protein